MTPVICVTGTHHVGISFLDWSLHWLSGNHEVFHWQQGWQPLAHNPMTAVNAHGHARNHVSGLLTTQQTIHTLSKTPAGFHTIYPVNSSVDNIAIQLGYDHSVRHDPEQWQKLLDLCDQEYAEIWKYCSDSHCECVFVATQPDNQVYHAQSLDRAQHAIKFHTEAVSDTFLKIHEVFFESKLSDTLTTWDRRELLALNLQLDIKKLGHEYLDFGIPHTWINCREIWYHGCELLPRLMRDLDLPFDHTRLQHWQEVYAQWQKMNYQFLQFQYELDHIIQATVNNWYYPLHNLTFLQEVIIQHELIYKHGLNIKNWQLEHFPDNTQKLHQLLEINHHQLRSTA